MVNKDHITDGLRSCLQEIRCKNVHQRWFIPGLCLRQILSESAIRRELSAAGVKSYSVEEIARLIMDSGIRIFGTLVLIAQAAAVPKFIEKGEFHDFRLPFNQAAIKELLPSAAARDFEEKQWEFIAPEFYRGTVHRSLRAEFVLPFVKDERIGNGAFGTVYEIELHRDHQELDGVFGRRLVRKELDNIKSHVIELENLAILSHLRHPNIVELLASYTYQDRNQDKHNLIFPLADGGTLAQLFATNRQTTPFSSYETSFSALAGISSAIYHVHDFAEDRIELELIGCHYDLRPKNILVSTDTLLLADFGLSRFKDTSESSATIFKQGGGDYRAPECETINDENFSKHIIRRSSDIWSFGCILAESATYIVFGSTGVDEFSKMRCFKEGKVRYRLFHRGPCQPNEAVSEWLSLMMPKCSKSCRMTIELINQMLSMNDKDRPTARRVTGTLRLITLYEAADSVEKLLYIIQSNDSFDSLIERTRFQAWRYALGILEAQTVADFAKEASEWHINQFGSMLDTLRRTREWLNSIISNPKNIATGYPFHLTVLNDSLDESLSERLQEISKSYFKTSILQDVGGDSSLLLPREIRLRAALKHMTGLALQHYERDTCRRQLDVRLVKIGAAFEDHNIGKYQVSSGLHPVLVEWRYYGRQTSDKAVNYELLVRVDAIAELLSQEKPEEFCALDCRGFFHDTSRSAFGVIYDYPQTTGLSQGTLTPQSLHHLLKETFQKGERHPTLDDKFRVAYILCRSVLEFHLVNWLHKRLCSSNVAFFHTTESLEDEWFQKPYIVGFNHSRPDEPSAFTGGPEESSINHYQHPLYLSDSRRFCADFDYYSLGIILLEIGLWRPLESMTRRYKGSYEEIRQLLIRERVPLLKQCMGRAYCEVVEICLRGTFGGSELTDKQAPVADSLQSNFNMMVVQKLKGLSELS